MRALEKKTGVVNTRLLSRPKLRTEDQAYFEGYRILSNTRQTNDSGMQPFLLTEVNAYTELADIPKGYPRKRFVRMIQALDSVHLDWFAKKRKREMEKLKSKK